MKNQWKGFISGIVVTLLCVGLVGSAFAAYQKQATLDYTGIKITLNGTPVTPKDVSGNAVEPFAIEGTTYLPVRGIASALGLNADWDQATQTVKLTDGSGGITAPSSSSSGTVIMEKNNIRVTFMGFAQKGSGLKGYDIKLKIENSSEKNYTVQVRNLSVNGIMADSIFSADVAAGKTANDAIWVCNMEERGIEAPITSAEFYLHVFESDTYGGDFDSDIITVR